MNCIQGETTVLIQANGSFSGYFTVQGRQPTCCSKGSLAEGQGFLLETEDRIVFRSLLMQDIHTSPPTEYHMDGPICIVATQQYSSYNDNYTGIQG